jgi:hypothetical protein
MTRTSRRAMILDISQEDLDHWRRLGHLS